MNPRHLATDCLLPRPFRVSQVNLSSFSKLSNTQDNGPAKPDPTTILKYSCHPEVCHDGVLQPNQNIVELDVVFAFELLSHGIVPFHRSVACRLCALEGLFLSRLTPI